MKVNTPDLGVDNTKISQIMVKVGDYVAEDDCLIIAESDKATIEIPSPASGIVTAILVKQGDDISEGKPLVVIEDKQMTVNIQAPKFPDSVTNGTIISWHVTKCNKVAKNQLLAEIETDKVVLEVVAPDDGVIVNIIKDVDSPVKSNEVIAQLKSVITETDIQSLYNADDNTSKGFSMNSKYILLEIKDQNGYRTKKINISDLPISIGRDMHSDVYINGTYASSRHGRIKFEHNSLIYEDFSKNGTFINGKAIHYTPNKSIVINQDDEIILAGYYPNQQRDFPCIIIKEVCIKDDELQELRSQLERRIFDLVDLLHRRNKNPILHVGLENYIESHTKTVQSAKRILSWDDEQLMADACSYGLLEYDIASSHSKPSHTPIAQEYVEPSFNISHDDVKIIRDEEGSPIQLSENGQMYELEKLGSGGTATVYQYQKNGEYKAVKIYNTDLIATHNHEYQEKLQTMLRTKPESAKTIVNGQEYTQFVWPETLVYDKNELVGYTMQALPKSNLYQLSTYIRNLKHLDKNHHSIFYRIQVARNLAIAVQNLHKAGHYFVDVKPENIFVFKDKCNVCFIDCDGFSIQQGKYPAQHYSKGYQAPFVLQNKLKPVHLSSEPYQDYYCLAHLIFEILDFSNRPFSGGVNSDVLIDKLMDMDGDSTYDYKVEHGLYPYHLQDRDDITPFHKSTFRSWPIGLRKWFDLAFVGNKEALPTPLDWAKELGVYIQNQDFETCQNEPNNPLHHHFKGMGCPICHLSGKSNHKTNTKPKPESMNFLQMQEKAFVFTYAISFSEGLAYVRKNDKWGFIDKSGRMITGFEYDSASDFSEGLARVKKKDKEGFIDKSGRTVIGFEYDGAWNFSEGLALVKKNGKGGFIDKKGQMVIGFTYDYAGNFSEGLAYVKKNDKWGFIDKSGRMITGFEYDSASDFSEGLAYVRKNGKGGFIDKSGRMITGFEYDGAWNFSEGLAYVRKNGKGGFIDKSGRMITGFEYDGAWNFSEGLAYVRKNGKVGYIDKSGRMITGFEYDSASDFSEGLAYVRKNDKWGFIDKSGRMITGFEYDSASDFSEGLAYVKKNGKYGFIDKSGRMITGFEYDSASDFSEGLAYVRKNDKWGFIDKTGKPLVIQF